MARRFRSLLGSPASVSRFRRGGRGQMAPGSGGAVKVTAQADEAGLHRKNGVPYSANAKLIFGSLFR